LVLLQSRKVLLHLPRLRGGELADRPTRAGPARLNLAPPAVSIRGRGIQRVPLPRPATPRGRLPPARDRPHRPPPPPPRAPPDAARHRADHRRPADEVPGAPAAVPGPRPLRVPPRPLPGHPGRPDRRDPGPGLEALRGPGPPGQAPRDVRDHAGAAVLPGG